MLEGHLEIIWRILGDCALVFILFPMIYRFGRFELDGAKIELRAEGEVCSIEPQVFALLTLLVENRERVVFKQEIIEKVWDGRIVSDTDSACASRSPTWARLGVC